MDLSYGLGISGIGGVVLTWLFLLIRYGMKSKCIVGGHTISIDVHATTSDEGRPSPERRPVVVVPGHRVSVVRTHGQPPPGAALVDHTVIDTARF